MGGRRFTRRVFVQVSYVDLNCFALKKDLNCFPMLTECAMQKVMPVCSFKKKNNRESNASLALATLCKAG